jgi:hypothetical protein
MNEQVDILLTWILPPVHDLSVAYSKGEYFQFGTTWAYFLWLAGYIGIEIVAYVGILRRKGVE